MIELSWPPRALHPNARVHWGQRSKAAKAYRREAWVLTNAAKPVVDKTAPVGLRIEFFPPDNRRRDTDGMLSAIKSGIDGIADALGVDDSRFMFAMCRRAPVEGGKVVIEVMQ